jgi:hypothetical protein
MNRQEDDGREESEVPTVRFPTSRPPATPSATAVAETRRSGALETFTPPKVPWSRVRHRGRLGRPSAPRVFPAIERG